MGCSPKLSARNHQLRVAHIKQVYVWKGVSDTNAMQQGQNLIFAYHGDGSE